MQTRLAGDRGAEEAQRRPETRVEFGVIASAD
jgi:hypothetical protein